MTDKKYLFLLVIVISILIHKPLTYAVSSIDQLNAPLVRINEQVMPSVVHLRVKREFNSQTLFGEGPNPFGNKKLNPQDFPPQIAEMVGSGVIVSSDGYVVTNNHVIANADEIKVLLDNNEEYSAKVIGTDKFTDLAVIQFKAKKGSFKVARLGNSDRLRVGEIVLALGSPFGLRKSVTQGIVSAKGRKNDIGFGVNYIQTDAAINPGNSGGALVNMKGEVIGINSLILSRSMNRQTAGFQGIGLAIPINLVKKVMKEIITHGRVIRGFLGIIPANGDLQSSKGLRIKKGILINAVVPNSPADKGGIKAWDMIIQVGIRKTDNFDQLRKVIAGTKVGKAVQITLIRKKKKIKVKVVIGDFDKFNGGVSKKIIKDKKPKIDYTDPSIGLKLKSLTADEKKLFKNIKVTYGVQVLKVKRNSIASKAGVQPGDVLLEVEGEAIKSPASFQSSIRSYKKAHFCRIRLIRKMTRILILPVTL